MSEERKTVVPYKGKTQETITVYRSDFADKNGNFMHYFYERPPTTDLVNAVQKTLSRSREMYSD